MTERSVRGSERIFLRFPSIPAAVAAAAAALAIAALGCGKSDKATDDALAYVPADAVAVMGFNIEGLRTGAARDVFTKMLEADLSYRALKRACGFDPLASIDRAVIAIRDLDAGPSGVIVLKGRSLDKLFGCTPDDPTVRRKGKYILVEEGGDSGVFAQADATTLVGLFGDRPTTAELDEALRRGPGLSSLDGFMDMYREIKTRDTWWFVARGDLLEKIGFGREARSVGGSANVAKRPTIDVRIRFRSAEAARETVDGELERKIDEVRRKGPVEDIRLRRDGAVVTVGIVLTPEALKGLSTDW